MFNASTTRAPPVGRPWAILGGGIFDRNYGEFRTGVDTVTGDGAGASKTPHWTSTSVRELLCAQSLEWQKARAKRLCCFDKYIVTLASGAHQLGQLNLRNRPVSAGSGQSSPPFGWDL